MISRDVLLATPQNDRISFHVKCIPDGQVHLYSVHYADNTQYGLWDPQDPHEYILRYERADEPGGRGPGLSPNLLATNKAINAETRAILYGQELIFADNASLTYFARRVGQVNLALVKTISIQNWPFHQDSGMSRSKAERMTKSGFRHLIHAVNLEKINLITPQLHGFSWNHYRPMPDRLIEVRGKYYAKHFFDRAKRLLRAMKQRRGLDAALDIVNFTDPTFSSRRRPRKERLCQQVFKAELRRLLEEEESDNEVSEGDDSDNGDGADNDDVESSDEESPSRPLITKMSGKQQILKTQNAAEEDEDDSPDEIPARKVVR